MGPYPFGIFGIQPKMRSGRRFENQNQHLQPYTAPNCKKSVSWGVNHLKKGPLCTRHVQKIWSDTWEGLWVTILLEFLKSDLK